MKIRIRQANNNDASQLYEAVNESIEHLAPWMPWCTSAYSLQDAVEWAGSAEQTRQAGSDHRFVIEDSNQMLLGVTGINQIVAQNKIGNLGYWVRRSALNQGVATHAARLTVEYAFQTLGLQRVEVHVHQDNHASNAVAAKLGGIYEGVFRNKLLLNAEPQPANCYSIIPRDYWAEES